MRAYILEGNPEDQASFIKDIREKNNVAAYNIHSFDTTLKIAEAREIKSVISGTIIGGGARIIVIYKNATIEAQNALLKTIEELPDDSFIFFLESQDLLPTIFSRCTVVNLGQKSKKEIGASLEGLEWDRQLSFSSALLLVDSIFKGSDTPSYEEIVLSLRRELLAKIGAEDMKTSLLLYKITRSLNRYFPLVKINNMNPRLIVERIILEVSNPLQLPY
jgi:DNA polymerase III gamma/tau subunit